MSSWCFSNNGVVPNSDIISSSFSFMATHKSSNNQLLEQQQHQLQDHNQHQLPYRSMKQSSSSSSPIPLNFNISKDGGSYDLGELDQALFLYLDGQQDHHNHSTSTATHSHENHHQSSTGMRPPTLNIFPAQPMYAVDPPSSTNKASTGRGGGVLVSSSSKRASEPSMDLVVANTRNDNNNNNTITVASASAPPPNSAKAIKREGNRKGPSSSSEQEGPKTPDPKTLRRLAQNREAARKSRLRKKAYVQQLESSRIKLNQLEQELQRARNQGIFFGGDQGLQLNVANISSDATVFDMEYTRWLEEHHRLMCELRAAVEEHLPENELRLFVDNCLAHYDEVMNLKSMVAKSDVFHLISGMWKTPAERCFMWMGGFRPSELIKVVLGQIEPLTEQQILGICGLQQSTQEAEEALSQGLEALNQSLSDTIASESLSAPPNNMGNYMNQMALAMNKLSAMEGFVRQADNLRHQTIHRLHQILTTRQAARCLLTITEYFHRLRALSSLWMSRPRQD